MITGLIPGIIITLTVVFYASPSIMFKEHKSKHDFDTTLAELEKTVAVNKTEEIIVPLFD